MANLFGECYVVESLWIGQICARFLLCMPRLRRPVVAAAALGIPSVGRTDREGRPITLIAMGF